MSDVLIDPNLIRTYEMTNYNLTLAIGIGNLMPQLDPSFAGGPTPEARLRRIVESPFHAQFVSVYNTHEVMGACTVSTILEPGFEAQGYLGAVVTNEAYRGAGLRIGERLMGAVIDWASNNDIAMGEVELLTETDKPGNPLGFYEKLGAKLRPTTRALVFDVANNNIRRFE